MVSHRSLSTDGTRRRNRCKLPQRPDRTSQACERIDARAGRSFKLCGCILPRRVCDLNSLALIDVDRISKTWTSTRPRVRPPERQDRQHCAYLSAIFFFLFYSNLGTAVLPEREGHSGRLSWSSVSPITLSRRRPSDVIVPSALIGAVDAEGRSIFAGRAVNCFTNAEGLLNLRVTTNARI